MKSLTIETYNAFSDAYDAEVSEFWRNFSSPFIQKFADAVHGTVLNIGCGAGHDGLLLKSLGVVQIGIDASEAMVHLTESRGIKARLGDMLSLQFRDERFDGVWSYMTHVHLPKQQLELGIAEIARVLKPGGWMALGMQEGTGESYKESSGLKAPRWFALYTEQELRDVLEKYGLQVFWFERMKPKSKTYLHFLCQKSS